MSYTAKQLIEGALRLIGQLAEGETVGYDTANDCLLAMNQMLSSWSTERLSVFSTMDQVKTWPPNSINESLGPTGSLGGERPILLDDSTYFRDPQTNVSFGIKFINQSQYDGIAVKTVTSTYPTVMFTNMTYPNIDMYIYPRPTRSLEFHFISVEPLSEATSLNTEITFPPGYLRAFRYNLACEIAPEFGVEPPPHVVSIAITSKRNLKRINNPDDVMSLPYAVVANRQRFNIYSGNF